ncbi:hypothetical protein PCASD_02777 [Puccinia coronata f. sp. avenae]|uniref:Uncharacterized protein n=1 Tax=Puccinia coronata f. sp. avenae TaxID=200324 RepID=A0A2N5VFT0_9BASI|nr:hypothetical protein PCASD_02777 [Puccinia coronata f. sp. avenae]
MLRKRRKLQFWDVLSEQPRIIICTAIYHVGIRFFLHYQLFQQITNSQPVKIRRP